MLQKIRELMTIKEDIVALNKDIEENRKIVADLKNELELLNKRLDELKKSQQDFLKNFKEDFGVIKDLREEFQNELYEFKLLKSQLQRKIMEKFEEELRKDLDTNKDILKKDIEEYTKLRKNAEDIFSAINSTSEEIKKFAEIGKSIRKEDFELSNFARQLHFADREKLGLMRRIEQLENVIAKMRRERPRIG